MSKRFGSGIGVLTLFLLSVRSPEAKALGAERIVVAVGDNVGAENEETLRFAEADAARFVDLMVEIGATERERTTTLLSKSAVEVRAALAEAKGRVAELRAAGRSVHLFFYYAGHGDETYLHMGDTVLGLAELERTVSGIPADLRIIIIDACRTSGASRDRGVHAGRPFNIVLRDVQQHGTIILSSASPGEPAQESDELGGAVFSHFLFSALRGAADTNGDGMVTFDESYQYAYARTLQRTAVTTAPVQHPNYDTTLEGRGALTLTWLERATARLVLPGGGQGTRYLVSAVAGGAVLAEVEPAALSEVVIALPAGRFVVACRSAGGQGTVTVELPWGGERHFAEDECAMAPASTTRGRGTGGMPARWVGALHYSAELAPMRQSPIAHVVSVRVEEEEQGFDWDCSLEAADSPLSWRYYEGHERELRLLPTLGYRAFGPWYAMRVGAGPTLGVTWQHLQRHEAERLRAAGFSAPDASYWGPQVGIAATAGLRVDVLPPVALELSARAQARWRRERDTRGSGIAWSPAVAIGLGVVWAL